MQPISFDPFGDRAAREIRNTLSAAFVAAWREGPADLPAVAAALQARHPHPVYRRWIVERLAAYRAAWRDRAEREAPDLFDDLVRLWNRRLFFEVHELLEVHWRQARGARREALQALILAAGVYVHREAGRQAAVASLSRRAAARLEACREHLPAIANLEELCRRLEAAEAPPPLRARHPPRKVEETNPGR